jgi:enoyl-CoA hydratase/carnithine racemase
MADQNKFFRVVINGHVAEVVLNNPSKLNTMSIPWALELGSIVEALEANDDVHCILVWAEGKIFTAGLDLKEFSSLSAQSRFLPRIVTYLHQTKPGPLQSRACTFGRP